MLAQVPSHFPPHATRPAALRLSPPTRNLAIFCTVVAYHIIGARSCSRNESIQKLIAKPVPFKAEHDFELQIDLLHHAPLNSLLSRNFLETNSLLLPVVSSRGAQAIQVSPYPQWQRAATCHLTLSSNPKAVHPCPAVHHQTPVLPFQRRSSLPSSSSPTLSHSHHYSRSQVLLVHYVSLYQLPAITSRSYKVNKLTSAHGRAET